MPVPNKSAIDRFSNSRFGALVYRRTIRNEKMSQRQKPPLVQFATGATLMVLFGLCQFAAWDLGRLNAVYKDTVVKYVDAGLHQTDEQAIRACGETTGAAAAKCMENAVNVTRESRRDEEQLASQKEATEISRYALFVSFAGLLVSAGGIYFLWSALNDTRRSQEHEFRAYVRIEAGSGGVIMPGKRIVLPHLLVNYGRTPALNAATCSALVVRNAGWFWEDASIPDGDRPLITIHPGDPMRGINESEFVLDARSYDAIVRGDAHVFATTMVLYEDVFGKAHETVVCHEVWGKDAVADGRVHLSLRGHKAT